MYDKSPHQASQVINVSSDNELINNERINELLIQMDGIQNVLRTKSVLAKSKDFVEIYSVLINFVYCLSILLKTFNAITPLEGFKAFFHTTITDEDQLIKDNKHIVGEYLKMIKRYFILDLRSIVESKIKYLCKVHCLKHGTEGHNCYTGFQILSNVDNKEFIDLLKAMRDCVHNLFIYDKSINMDFSYAGGTFKFIVNKPLQIGLKILPAFMNSATVLFSDLENEVYSVGK